MSFIVASAMSMVANYNLSTKAVDEQILIGEGEFRRVTRGKYTEGERSGQYNVNKVFKTGGVYEDIFFESDIKASDVAVGILQRFASFARHYIVRINKPEVWVFTDGLRKGQKVLIEPFLQCFQKFNSNTGKADDRFEIMQALSHFSYHDSGGERILCDLQGSVQGNVYTLSDVVVLSQKQEFGATDLGIRGMENFFHHHRCNSFCHHSWKKWSCASAHFVPTMTTTMALPLRRPIATPMVSFFQSPHPKREPWYCRVCDRYHRPDTTCPKENVCTKDQWTRCYDCQRDHKPDTVCPKDRTKVSDSWSYCGDCDRRHKEIGNCPKRYKRR